jgi:hypothetical protein
MKDTVFLDVTQWSLVKVKDISYLPPSLDLTKQAVSLKMDAVCASKSHYQTAWRHIPEDSRGHSPCHKAVEFKAPPPPPRN